MHLKISEVEKFLNTDITEETVIPEVPASVITTVNTLVYICQALSYVYEKHKYLLK